MSGLETSLVDVHEDGVLRADDGCECCYTHFGADFHKAYGCCGRSPCCCCNTLCGIRVWIMVLFVWLLVFTVLALLPLFMILFK